MIRISLLQILLFSLGLWCHLVYSEQEVDRFDNPKISIAISARSSPHRKSSKPYFATFDSTNAAYHWESQFFHPNEEEKVHELQVLDIQDLPPHIIKSLFPNGIEGHSLENIEVDEEDFLEGEVDVDSVLKSAKFFRDATPFNIQEFLVKRRPFFVITLCECEKDKLIARALPRFESLIEKNNAQDQLSWLICRLDASRRFQLSQVFSLDEQKDYPAALIDNIVVGANLEKYRFEGLLNANLDSIIRGSDLWNFVRAFMDKKLPLVIRSAPEPLTSADNTAVVEVVGSSFTKIVLQKNQNVFLVVYSPRCGASIAIMPVIEAVAREVKENPDIYPNTVVAKMDGTVNDFPIRGIRMNYYPSAFYFTAGEKIKENGEINLLYWDDWNGSKTPHNKNIPVRSSI